MIYDWTRFPFSFSKFIPIMSRQCTCNGLIIEWSCLVFGIIPILFFWSGMKIMQEGFYFTSWILSIKWKIFESKVLKNLNIVVICETIVLGLTDGCAKHRMQGHILWILAILSLCCHCFDLVFSDPKLHELEYMTLIICSPPNIGDGSHVYFSKKMYFLGIYSDMKLNYTI